MEKMMLIVNGIRKAFGVSDRLVRTLVKSGKVVAVQSGNKYLINAQKFGEYLDNCHVELTTENDQEK